jgi:hypothetical protein
VLSEKLMLFPMHIGLAQPPAFRVGEREFGEIVRIAAGQSSPFGQ